MLPMVQTEAMLYNCGAQSDEAAPPSATLPPALTPDSEIEELVDIFLDVDVDVAVDGFAKYLQNRLESCDLQPGDTWRGTQDKMSVTAPVKKIRKTSNKPQSQTNKCHNEKRRRELENETINQLEELLETCLAQVKQPDKNGIVREATRQIQEVLKRRLECPSECPLRAQAALGRSPVQAGDISCSSEPQSSAQQYSEITTLIEALKYYTGCLGWTLLEINAKGEIACVTENIKELIPRDKTELLKKSVFDIVHEEDHGKITPLLRNINQTFTWSAAEGEKFSTFQTRLLTEDSNGTNVTGCVECVIHAAPVRSSAERAGSVMCVIRRCEDASAALLPVDGGPPAITATRTPHIVFRLDSANFNVLSCDLSGVDKSSNYPLLVGTNYLDLVESCDRGRVAAHLHEAQCQPAPPAEADCFRLRVAPDEPWVRVSACSRRFPGNAECGEREFIMSTHSVLADEPERAEPAPAPPSAQRPPLGGPLMTSVVNGESSGDARPRGNSPDLPFPMNDFEFEPWTSSFQFTDMSSEDSKERKESLPGTPAPRAPSAPLDAPPGPAAPPADDPAGRLRKILTKKPDSNILKDLLKQEDEEATSSETSAPHTPHTPQTPHTPHTPHTPAAALSPLHSSQAHARAPPHPAHPAHASHMQHSHHNSSDVLLKMHGIPTGQPGYDQILKEKEKSDEEPDESRRSSESRGSSQPSALLSQLLSSSNGPARGADDAGYLAGMKRRHEESKGVGLPKRMTPDNQQVTSSAVAVASSAPSSTAVSPSTSSPGMSPLCQKNQILVALLARQQTVPPPPQQSNPVLRAYAPAPRPRVPLPHHQQHQPHQQHPQHQQHQQMHPAQRHHNTALSNMLAQSRASGVNVNGGPIVSTAGGGGAGPAGGGGEPALQSHLAMVLQGGARPAYPPAPHPAPPQQMHYAAPAPHHGYAAHPPSGRTQAAAGGGGGGGAGEMDAPSNDQDLSDILDEVIDIDIDNNGRAPMNVLGELDNSRQQRTDFASKEKMAIVNAIRQSLMQCETVTKSPVATSPGAPPPVYSMQSPGGQCTMSGLGGGGAGYGLGGEARARALQAEQQRARLLQMQRSQQMVVISPEAADQSQQDLGSTINALVSGTAPNVNITRTDYHHLYHPSNQIGSNYGTNKITSPQQNPMLSRQLSGPAAGGYAHGPAALHTPMTPQPYARAPRPQLVGSYYEDGAGAGYCGEFARRPLLAPHAPLPAHPNHPSPLDQQMPCAGNGGVGGVAHGAGSTREYVRNELRAVVGARARPDLHHAPSDLDPLISFDMPAPGGGSAVGGRAPAAPAGSWESQQTPPSTTEAGSAAAAAGAAGGDGARAAGAPTSASLLQKLLSQ